MLTILEYRYIFFAAILLWAVPDLIVTFIIGRTTAGARRDRGSALVLLGALFLGIVVAIKLSNVGPAITGHLRTGFWLGIVLMIAGVAFRWYAIRYLGRSYSPVVKVQTNQQVVTTGPYRWIRHPAYTGSLITLLGFGIVINTWGSLLAVFAIGFVGIWYRVKVEEGALAETLGQSYVDYMQHTRRFIPYIF